MIDSFVKKQKFLIIFLVITFAYLIFAQIAKADSDGIGRTRTCNENGKPESLQFDPTMGGKDVEFVMSNPVCIAVAAYAYSATKVQIAKMNYTCNSGDATPRITPSPLLDSYDIARAGIKSPTAPNKECPSEVALSVASFASTIAMIAPIYAIANSVFDNSHICGSNWMSANATQYQNNNPDHKATVENEILEYIEKGQTEKLVLSDANNKSYREWYYGGVEVEDNSDDGYCPDVTQQEYDGIYPAQKYYLKGLDLGNYNCKKYLVYPGQADPRDGTIITDDRLKEFQDAYDCCKSRAREYICIEYNGERKFCKGGTRCSMGGIAETGITFSAKTIEDGRLVCAETYSLCPYNFTISGGSEECEYYQDGIEDSDGTYTYITPADVIAGHCSSKSEIRNDDCTYNAKVNRCKNYCQYMTHCTMTDLSDYQYTSSIASPYFSTACINFVGDSKNQVSYGTGFIAGSARHFSAPIAQCTKETIENVFYNKAGHTSCYTEGDAILEDGSCLKGTDYKKGDQVNHQSFFARMQQLMAGVVKAFLTLFVMFHGMKLLATGKDGITKKEMLPLFLKVGLVIYFVSGTAWQDVFFEGVYNASSSISRIVFKIQTPTDQEKRDGCQFGNISLEDGSQIASGVTYPKDKQYLAIWDTLDCKIARYLGFGPEISAANIAKLILAGFITGSIGIYFSISLLAFGVLLISATLRALHIFLSTSVAIIVMVYVSPLIIPLVLFKKTESIFNAWLQKLLVYCMQPIILFAYLAIFISIMDKTLIGSAKFYGESPNRVMSCDEYCQDATGAKVAEEASPNCDRTGESLVTPKADSVMCMLSYNSFGDWPGLELIGITLPFLIDFFTSHTEQKILTIAKAALIMYFLFKFMDEIPEITTQLIGEGVADKGKTMSYQDLMKKVRGIAGGIQKRGQGAIKQGAGKIREGGEAVKGMIGEAGNKGKSVDQDEKAGGSDSAQGSTGGDDAARSSSGSDGASSSSSGSDGSGSSSSGSDGAR